MNRAGSKFCRNASLLCSVFRLAQRSACFRYPTWRCENTKNIYFSLTQNKAALQVEHDVIFITASYDSGDLT